MRHKINFGVDMDGVIAALTAEWVKRYNSDYNDNLKPSDITMWNWHSLTKCGKKIYEYLDDPSIFRNLPVIKDSQSVLYEMSKDCEIVIVTSPFNMANALPKDQWLDEHFPFIGKDKRMFVGDKSLADVDYLLDDKPKNLEQGNFIPLIYSAPHNKDEKRFTRIKNWQHMRLYYLQNIRKD